MATMFAFVLMWRLRKGHPDALARVWRAGAKVVVVFLVLSIAVTAVDPEPIQAGSHASPTALPYATGSGGGVPGDVTGDGIVDGRDALRVMQFVERLAAIGQSAQDGQISVFAVPLGDATHDCRVDTGDLNAVASIFNANVEDDEFVLNTDLNDDDVINIFDLVTVGANFGATCQ